VNILIQDNSRSYYSAYPVDHKRKSSILLYLTEFLNSSSPSEIPPHRLNLKINTNVTLIRKLNVNDRLVNGTRMIVKGLHEYAEITGAGKIIFTPRIQLHSSDPTTPFKASRRQFPIKIVLAITISNALGLMLKHAGMHLPSPVFVHGQLYGTLTLSLFI
jgi:hypothetical protein